jgi:hypothetical protein
LPHAQPVQATSGAAEFGAAGELGITGCAAPDVRRTTVGIGASIFLIAIGAVLTFALDINVGGVNLDVIGWILIIAGVLGLIMTTLIWGRRRTVVAPPVEDRVVTEEPVEYRRVEERRRDLDPPL